METALQQLKEWVSKEMLMPNGGAYTKGELLDKIQSLIPTEKEQIEIAWCDGRNTGMLYPELNKVASDKREQERQDYYTQTYQCK